MEIQIYAKEWRAPEMVITWINICDFFIIQIPLEDNSLNKTINNVLLCL